MHAYWSGRLESKPNVLTDAEADAIISRGPSISQTRSTKGLAAQHSGPRESLSTRRFSTG